MLEYNTKQKKNKTKSYHALIPYAGQPPALDLHLKGRGGGGGGGGGGGVEQRGEQSLVVKISYKGYSPPKCT